MLTLIIAGALALIYGALIAFFALKDMRQKKLEPNAAAQTGFIGMIIMFSALFIPFRLPAAFYILLLSIIAMHYLAYKREKTTPTKNNRALHIFASLLILFLAYIGIFTP
jgi:uncharacterized membrane protein